MATCRPNACRGHDRRRPCRRGADQIDDLIRARRARARGLVQSAGAPPAIRESSCLVVCAEKRSKGLELCGFRL